MHRCLDENKLDPDDMLCRYCLDDLQHGEALQCDPEIRRDAAEHLRELRTIDMISAHDQRARYRRLLMLVEDAEHTGPHNGRGRPAARADR